MEGTLYSRFEVIETLYSSPGEFAEEAYRARESATDSSGTRPRTVLMRSLPRVADTRTVLDAIIRSSRLGSHPAILATYGVIEAPEEPDQPPTPFLISEYTRGILLSERIKRLAPFSLKTALDIAIEVAEALAYADAGGLDTHDIRPQDIVCTSDGDIKVADIEVGQAIRTAEQPVMTYVSGAACVSGLVFEMLTGKSALLSSEIPALSPSVAPELLRTLVDEAFAGSITSISEFSAGLKSIRSEVLGSSANRTRQLQTHALPTSQFLSRASSPSVVVENNRFQPTAVSNPTAEILPPEYGKNSTAHAEILSNPATVTAQPTAGKSGGQHKTPRDYDDNDNTERAGGMNWPRQIGTVLKLLLAVGIIGFCVYVGLQVSNVPNDVAVPSLVGQQFTDASQKAEQSHIHLVQAGHDYSDTWPQGAIYEQDPQAGRMIKADKSVDVKVSDGPRLTPVPDLSQMTLKRAQGTLQDSGLPIGNITYTFDNATPKGIVTSQTPQSGSNISRTTAVNLMVSKGPSPPSAPSNLSATCTVAGEIDLAWSEGQTPQTYDVYRDGVKIASEIPEATYSDVGLPDTTVHVYTVTAVNSNGESPKSAPASASDNPDSALTAANATGASSLTPTPVSAQPSLTAAPGAPKERQFNVRFHVPNTGTSHKVQIDIQDTTGTTEVFNQEMYGGDEVNKSFQAFGNRVILRIFIDGKLVRQQPE